MSPPSMWRRGNVHKMLNDSPFSEKIKKRCPCHVFETHIYFCFKHSFFRSKTGEKNRIFISFKGSPVMWLSHDHPKVFLAAARRDCAYDANKQAWWMQRRNSAPTPLFSRSLHQSLPSQTHSVFYFCFVLSFFSSLIFVFLVRGHRSGWWGCRWRTSAGVAVPATTSIKISRPDVNYRLESFAERNEREREKKG